MTASLASAQVSFLQPEGRRPIDLVHLARQTFGERRLENELLAMFGRQAAQIMVALALDAADRAATRRPSAPDLLHTLVGSARVVGAFVGARSAESLERTLRQPETSAAQDRPTAALRDLGVIVDEACRFIAELLAPA